MRTAPTFRSAAIAAVLASAGVASAQVPSYSGLSIQAASGSQLFNLPSGASLSSENPQINNAGQVSFRFLSPNFTNIWLGTAASGSTVAAVDTSSTFVLVGTPSLSASGFLVWNQDLPTNGIYRYNPVGPVSGLYFNRPLGTQTYGSPRVNDAGQVGFRAGFGPTGQAWVSYDPTTNSTAVHAAENGIEPTANISFLFTPNFNNSRQIAGKVSRTTTSQEEIRVYSADGSSTLIAQDADLLPGSPYQGFDNSVGFNDNGDVAFIATRTAAAGGGRGVFLKKASDPAIITIALAGQGGVAGTGTTIEFFAPAVNNNGVVTFRAFNSSGQRAVWVGDGTTLLQVATRGTVVPLPAGGTTTIGRVDGSPDFGGGPEINDFGDVVFNAQIASGTSAGIIVAQAVRPPVTGACCAGVGCTLATASACAASGGNFKGAGVACNAPGTPPFTNDTTPCCRADFTQNGVREPGDIFAFLTAYFSTDPAQNALTDTNGNTTKEPADIFAFLNLYFAGGC